VGADNIFIFGLNVDEVRQLREQSYRPREYVERSPMLKRALELIRNNFFSPGEFDIFRPILDSLDYDNYMCAADFDSYAAVQAQVAELYRNPIEWQKKCLHNIAKMGYFSSDRSIKEYAEKIWDMKPCPINIANKHGFTLAASQLAK